MAMQLMRIEAVSEMTCIPVETLRFWRKRRKGEGPRSGILGGRIVYYLSDVEAWVREQLGPELHAPAPEPAGSVIQMRAV